MHGESERKLILNKEQNEQLKRDLATVKADLTRTQDRLVIQNRSHKAQIEKERKIADQA